MGLMSLFSSADLQRLMLGENRTDQNCAVRAQRVEMLKAISDEKQLAGFLDKLVNGFQGNVDKLVAPDASDYEDFCWRQNCNIGEIRLAANVAEFACDYAR